MEGLHCRSPLKFPRLHDPQRTCVETVTGLGFLRNANLCYYLYLCANIQLNQMKPPLIVKKKFMFAKKAMHEYWPFPVLEPISQCTKKTRPICSTSRITAGWPWKQSTLYQLINRANQNQFPKSPSQRCLIRAVTPGIWRQRSRDGEMAQLLKALHEAWRPEFSPRNQIRARHWYAPEISALVRRRQGDLWGFAGQPAV